MVRSRNQLEVKREAVDGGNRMGWGEVGQGRAIRVGGVSSRRGMVRWRQWIWNRRQGIAEEAAAKPKTGGGGGGGGEARWR